VTVPSDYQRDIGQTVSIFSLFEKDPDRLLKEATARKKAGDMDGAIECLRRAYKRISRTRIVYSVNTFLRLPLYLEQARRADEAWSEFNRLLTDGYPNQIRTRDLLPMHHSIIYDKMRLFLQREHHAQRAVKFGVFSHVSWCQGLYYQKRKDELAGCLCEDCFEGVVDELLEKANRLQVRHVLTNGINENLRSFPSVNYARLGKLIDHAVLE
jgi:hypothetical protein